jgi:hypothetical protein
MNGAIKIIEDLEVRDKAIAESVMSGMVTVLERFKAGELSAYQVISELDDQFDYLECRHSVQRLFIDLLEEKTG